MKREEIEKDIESFDENTSFIKVINCLKNIYENSELSITINKNIIKITESEYLGMGFECKIIDSIIKAIKKVFKKYLNHRHPKCCLYYKGKNMPDGDGNIFKAKYCAVCGRMLENEQKKIMKWEVIEGGENEENEDGEHKIAI